MASYVVGGRGVDMYIECTEISGFDRRRLVRTTPSFIGEASSAHYLVMFLPRQTMMVVALSTTMPLEAW